MSCMPKVIIPLCSISLAPGFSLLNSPFSFAFYKKFKLCHDFIAPESPLKSWLISPHQYISRGPNIQLWFSYEINRRKRAALIVFRAQSPQNHIHLLEISLKTTKTYICLQNCFHQNAQNFAAKFYLRWECIYFLNKISAILSVVFKIIKLQCTQVQMIITILK